MTVYTVSGKSEFESALKSADGNDTIVLKSGNYGSVYISRKYDANVTITSASASDQAVFKSLVANNVSNLTIDRITFVGSATGGYGDGVGLKLSKSSNITIENSKFTTYEKGIQVWGSSNLSIINNDINNISYDGMVLGHTQRVLIQGNDIDMNGRPGVDHKDNIQFYNEGTLAAASDITIRGNTLSSPDGMTHGIYMGNADARTTGNASEFYKNVLIENNLGETGQRLGICVSHADGVTIRGNEVLQHREMQSSREINTPVILVQEDSRRVVITGNTVLDAPSAANDAWADTKGGAGWTISGNKIVPLGTDAASGGGAPIAPPVPPAGSGNGTADNFRFDGDDLAGQERVVFTNVDFSEGDRITLIRFDPGTFRDYGAGNVVGNNQEENYVRIDSLVDIQELVTASPDVSALFQTTNDTLVVRVVQDVGVLDIALPGFAQDYKSTFNEAFF